MRLLSLSGQEIGICFITEFAVQISQFPLCSHLFFWGGGLLEGHTVTNNRAKTNYVVVRRARGDDKKARRSTTLPSQTPPSSRFQNSFFGFAFFRTRTDTGTLLMCHFRNTASTRIHLHSALRVKFVFKLQ